MQSHTYTASGSLSFRCESVHLEAVGSRSLSCLVHRRPLPALVSLGCYMSTSFRMVRPRTTPYWERSALIPIVTSQTTLIFFPDMELHPDRDRGNIPTMTTSDKREWLEHTIVQGQRKQECWTRTISGARA
ncbi:hypothetical protein MTR_6g012230 [Medicago truncatula]|uniref:Uncharacterized protein n=1 Tax=Medicago truncatula TaxID=3880 RepID=G7KKI0_MEDTR|nr:hypothetical protein MTR_6g012230 [Medicago truncatula]